MKIIHIVESFAGGVFDFLVDLTQGMPNHEHIIIYAKREHTPENFKDLFPSNTQFILWSNATREISPKKDFLALKELITYLKNFKDADAIHLHSSKAGFLGRIASRVLGLQNSVLYTPHGVSFLRKDVSRLKHKIFVYLEKLGSWCGGNVIACSESEAEAFQIYNIDANYVNNGIQCNSFSNANKTINHKKIKIGTIGRITYQKNPKLFNDIAEHFINNDDIEFVWIGGGGELEADLKAPNIIKTGWLSRDEVDIELSNIDIYLSTSLWEGLPLSVLQAMCAEKPLVLSDCVGNKNLVKKDYNGHLFNGIDEAIKSLNSITQNRESIEHFGKHSQKLVQKEFSINQMVDGYKQLYKDCTMNKTKI